jgi:glutamine---fructose-6-phosphate transaminase (isomerizing)
MCGIVGYVGNQKAAPFIIEGLKRLEYRGYDSAGIATIENNEFKIVKKVGRVSNLEKQDLSQLNGTIGIGHTRWATHGGVTDSNAHPHISFNNDIAIIHNGVIENYEAIKDMLTFDGYVFKSETDSEVLCNLIDYYYNFKSEAIENSVRLALQKVQGTFGIVVMLSYNPSTLIAARRGSPLICGLGTNEAIVASDVSAIISRTKNVVYLKDDEMAVITPDTFKITTLDNEHVNTKIDQVSWDIEVSDIGEYSSFMEKEIFEQPKALENAMRGRFEEDESNAKFGGLNITPEELKQVKRIIFCGCGTALHACLVTEYLIEKFAKVPVECEYASEFRYKNCPVDRDTLFIVMSQSGETIDTLSALREAKQKGFKVLAINNSVGSSIAREADGGIYQHVGPEVGVASTKAFTSQVLIGSMLALYLARQRGMSYVEGVEYVHALKSVPKIVKTFLDNKKQIENIKQISSKLKYFDSMYFLGRLSLHPIAMEGALKLKEISYIHAEAYPSAEMKHGPIALINERFGVVFVTSGGGMMLKNISSMQEIKARKGNVIAVVTEDVHLIEGLANDTIIIPACKECILPIIATIPLQLLALYTAQIKGCDVDKPRNLAKSVTVE